MIKLKAPGQVVVYHQNVHIITVISFDDQFIITILEYNDYSCYCDLQMYKIQKAFLNFL